MAVLETRGPMKVSSDASLYGVVYFCHQQLCRVKYPGLLGRLLDHVNGIEPRLMIQTCLPSYKNNMQTIFPFSLSYAHHAFLQHCSDAFSQGP